ncbi:NAD-dependent epimerase/dehydratase family protein, partial [Deinococcus pimensis]|uniref:NAD-dependent epimerase/dehydratase family protein n=1 Tax=Deinococcus pimensis TaxID=309888 RepID=UPI0012FB4FB1
KMVEAKERGAPSVEIWGSGTPLREFLFVDDLADACVFIMREVSEAGPINVGTGVDLSIRALAELIAEVVGFRGELVFDAGKPDGTPRKLMDVSRLSKLGWSARVELREGIERTLDWYERQREASHV